MKRKAAPLPRLAIFIRPSTRDRINDNVDRLSLQLGRKVTQDEVIRLALDAWEHHMGWVKPQPPTEPTE